MPFNWVNARKRRILPLVLLGALYVVRPSAAATQGMMEGRLAMGEETVAVGADGTLYVLAAPAQRGMGHELGRVVLFALDPATLRVRWRYALDEDLSVSRPVVSRDGTVYFYGVRDDGVRFPTGWDEGGAECSTVRRSGGDVEVEL